MTPRTVRHKQLAVSGRARRKGPPPSPAIVAGLVGPFVLAGCVSAEPDAEDRGLPEGQLSGAEVQELLLSQDEFPETVQFYDLDEGGDEEAEFGQDDWGGAATLFAMVSVGSLSADDEAYDDDSYEALDSCLAFLGAQEDYHEGDDFPFYTHHEAEGYAAVQANYTAPEPIDPGLGEEPFGATGMMISLQSYDYPQAMGDFEQRWDDFIEACEGEHTVEHDGEPFVTTVLREFSPHGARGFAVDVEFHQDSPDSPGDFTGHLVHYPFEQTSLRLLGFYAEDDQVEEVLEIQLEKLESH